MVILCSGSPSRKVGDTISVQSDLGERGKAKSVAQGHCFDRFNLLRKSAVDWGPYV